MPFLTEVSQTILKNSGWFTERDMDLDSWLDLLKKANYPIFDAWINVIRHFGGLEIITLPFQEKPFYIGEQQPAILLHKADPTLEFFPERSDVLISSEATLWKSLYYLECNQLQIAPIGIFRHTYTQVFPLFVLSNGSIYGGGRYFVNREVKSPGLFYLGCNIEDAINNIIEEFLVFW